MSQWVILGWNECIELSPNQAIWFLCVFFLLTHKMRKATCNDVHQFSCRLKAVKHYFEPKVLSVEGLRQAISSITKACASESTRWEQNCLSCITASSYIVMHRPYPNYWWWHGQNCRSSDPIAITDSYSSVGRDIHTSCSSAARLWRFLLMKELSWRWVGAVTSWHHFV